MRSRRKERGAGGIGWKVEGGEEKNRRSERGGGGRWENGERRRE